MLCLAAVPGFAQPEDRYWELGAGSYGEIPGGTEADSARWDWLLIQFGNINADLETIGRFNRYLELNPKQKYLVRLWPSAMGEHEGNWSTTFVCYWYDAAVRARVERDLRFQIRLVMDNIKRPGNVVGFTFLEELPGHWGEGPAIREGKLTPELEFHRAAIEEELGHPLKFDEEMWRWYGRRYEESMARLHSIIKEEAPGKLVLYWHHTNYRTLDMVPQDVPPETAGAFGGGMGLYPIRLTNIIKPGLCEGLMAYPNNREIWENQYMQFVRKYGWLHFEQLSHPSPMRITSWQDQLDMVKSRTPQNLGYFLYCEGNCRRGQGNDDPSLSAAPEDNGGTANIIDHVRPFCAQEDIGTPVMLQALAPQVSARLTLGQEKPGAVAAQTLLIHNPATPQYFKTPEEATARAVKLALTLPKGCRLTRESVPATLELGDLPANSWKTVEWSVKVDQPPAAGYETTVTLTSANRPPVTARFAGDSAIASFLPQEIRRSGYRWAENCIGGPEVPPYVTMEAMGEPVKSPSITDGIATLTYQATLPPGRRLVITPQGQARLYPGHLMPPTDFGLKAPAEASGYKPYTEGYGVAGKYVNLPLGEITRVRITAEGKVAEEGASYALMQFITPRGVEGVPCLGGLSAEWQRVSEELQVPQGATALHRILLYRVGSKGKVWYGTVEIVAADLDPAGVEVTDRLAGAPLTVPGGSFRVFTYADQGLPAESPKIRVQLWPCQPLR